jgi:hypothetical protein
MATRLSKWSARRASRLAGDNSAVSHTSGPSIPTTTATSPANLQTVGTEARLQRCGLAAPPNEGGAPLGEALPLRPLQPSDSESPCPRVLRRRSQPTDPYVETLRMNRLAYRQQQLETWGADDRAGEYFDRVRSEGGDSAEGRDRGCPRRRTAEPPPSVPKACPASRKKGRPRQQPTTPDRPRRQRRPPQPYWLASPPSQGKDLSPPVAHSPKSLRSLDDLPSRSRSRSRSPDQRVSAPRRSPAVAGRRI